MEEKALSATSPSLGQATEGCPPSRERSHAVQRHAAHGELLIHVAWKPEREGPGQSPLTLLGDG